MKALFLRCLLVAVIVGSAISLVSKVTRVQAGVKYDPPLSETEFHQMGNMTVNEMESTLAKRRIKMTRWDLLRESVPYAYFWKEVAHDAIVPICGVFVGCMWLGWMQTRRLESSTAQSIIE